MQASERQVRRECQTPPTSRGRPASVSTRSAPGGIRTPNLLIRNQMLYPLSYGRRAASGIPVRNVARLPVDPTQMEIHAGNQAIDYNDGPAARSRSTSDVASRSSLSHSPVCCPTRCTQASASKRDRTTPASTKRVEHLAATLE